MYTIEYKNHKNEPKPHAVSYSDLKTAQITWDSLNRHFIVISPRPTDEPIEPADPLAALTAEDWVILRLQIIASRLINQNNEWIEPEIGDVVRSIAFMRDKLGKGVNNAAVDVIHAEYRKLRLT